MTYGTVNDCVIAAGVCTVSGSLVFLNSVAFGMTGSVNGNVGSFKLTLTYGTVYYIVVAAGSDTVGRYNVFLNCLCGSVSNLGVLNFSRIRSAASVIAKRGLGAVLGTGSVVVGYVACILVCKSRTNVGHGIFLAAAVVTFSGLGSVLAALCIAVGNVIGVLMVKTCAGLTDSIGLAATVITLCSLSTI